MKTKASNNKLLCGAKAGYENLCAWADLLDSINVFPVADGDTGMNLRMSLAPLRDCGQEPGVALKLLQSNGRGNSGNIAVTFFSEFLKADEGSLAEQAEKARDRACLAVAEPKAGTMLEVFDALCGVLRENSSGLPAYPVIRERLRRAVTATQSRLPELEAAGVVDSGALGMFVFFDGFFNALSGKQQEFTPLMELFEGMLLVADTFAAAGSGEHCVEVTLASVHADPDLSSKIAELGSSAVIAKSAHGVKIHLHTDDPGKLRDTLSPLGDLLNWSEEAMAPMERIRDDARFSANRVRIMTDSAASIPQELGSNYGVILLDSYILASDRAVPESLLSPDSLYALMRAGEKVTTAQASNDERYLHYQAACTRYGDVLYIATGSAFTGNYATARSWKEQYDANENMEIIDSGAASGRLAVISFLAARLAGAGASMQELLSSVTVLIDSAEEFVFINELKYLVAGGRVSRTKGVFGDLFRMKPVISPMAEGVRKIAVVRNRAAQLKFALERIGGRSDLFVLLQYTDNREWLAEEVEPLLRQKLPGSEIVLLPLSLSSGVHMGPGTWSVAFAPTGTSQ